VVGGDRPPSFLLPRATAGDAAHIQMPPGNSFESWPRPLVTRPLLSGPRRACIQAPKLGRLIIATVREPVERCPERPPSFALEPLQGRLNGASSAPYGAREDKGRGAGRPCFHGFRVGRLRRRAAPPAATIRRPVGAKNGRCRVRAPHARGLFTRMARARAEARCVQSTHPTWLQVTNRAIYLTPPATTYWGTHAGTRFSGGSELRPKRPWTGLDTPYPPSRLPVSSPLRARLLWPPRGPACVSWGTSFFGEHRPLGAVASSK